MSAVPPTAVRIALSLAFLAGALTGCAKAQEPQPAPTVPAAEPAAQSFGDFGTLSQNDIAIRLRDDELEIRFVPLDPRVVGLVARDAATSLQRLLARHRAEVDSAAAVSGVSEPGLALVSFFGQLDAQLLTLTVQNRLLRPLAIVPLSPNFTSQQLDARASVMAIYLFEELLPVWNPFTVSYGALTSSDWERRLPTLERERARLAARPRRRTRRSPGS